MSGMKIWWSIDAAITRITTWFLWVAVVCLVFMMTLATVDIITTKFFSRPIPSAGELIEDFNIPLVFFGMAYVQLHGGHVAGALFENRFSKGVNKAIKVGGCVLGVIVSGFVGWRAVPLFLHWLESGIFKSGAISFPMWPFALVTVIGFALLALAFILSIVRIIASPEESRSETEAEIEIETEGTDPFA